MAEIIASIFALDPQQAADDCRRAAMAGVDWLELRLDRWPMEESLAPVIDPLRLPVLVSCRTPRDGGFFEGELRERVDLLERALEAGAEGLDLEGWEDWSPPKEELRLLIRSYHNFTRVPEDLPGIRDQLLERGAHMAKVVGMAHELSQAAPILELMASTDQAEEPTMAFAMGPSAAATRILSAALGAPMIYASLDDSAETAPGQMPISEVHGLYAVNRLGSQTGIFGLLGNPARHSLGPWLHNRALRAAGIDAVYLPFETSQPKEVIAMLPRRRLRGLSVTAPFKESMAKLCPRLSAEASAAGAVNTLTLEAHGQMVGHNTDVAGVREAFLRAGLSDDSAGEVGVVLGSGGAARAAAVALASLGMRVTIMARSLDKVRRFCREHDFSLASLRAEVLEELAPKALVNATPVGSLADPVEGERLLPEAQLPRGCFVLDMVYRPEWTALLIAAEEQGAVPVSGIEMFLTQAAEQLALFCGERPAEGELRRYLAGVL
ncbi:MAG: type I 3-dehydroquinate dehydratase [Planctomycetota bacterium]|jgi:3-dehydroquinate dehydratase/shikimate dehydrogenase